MTNQSILQYEPLRYDAADNKTDPFKVLMLKNYPRKKEDHESQELDKT